MVTLSGHLCRTITAGAYLAKCMTEKVMFHWLFMESKYDTCNTIDRDELSSFRVISPNKRIPGRFQGKITEDKAERERSAFIPLAASLCDRLHGKALPFYREMRLKRSL